MNFIEKYKNCLSCNYKLKFHDSNYYYCNNCYCIDRFIVSEHYVEYNINILNKPQLILWYNHKLGLLHLEKYNKNKIELNCFFDNFDVLEFLQKFNSNQIFE